MNAAHVFFTLGYILLALGYLSQRDIEVSVFPQQMSEPPDPAGAWYQRNANTLAPPSSGLPPSGWRLEPVTPPEAYGRFGADDAPIYGFRPAWNAEHRRKHRRPRLAHCPWR
jgi:hypothetical protein